MDEHLELLTRLEAINQSEDETDCEPPFRRSREKRFRIIRCEWMSDKLRAFLRSLDQLYLWDCLTDPEKKKQGGSTPRERFESNPVLSTLGIPALGLWRNCYNAAWLATLSPHERRALQIIDSDYVFPGDGGHEEDEDEDEDMTPSQPEFVQGSSRG